MATNVETAGAGPAGHDRNANSSASEHVGEDVETGTPVRRLLRAPMSAPSPPSARLACCCAGGCEWVWKSFWIAVRLVGFAGWLTESPDVWTTSVFWTDTTFHIFSEFVEDYNRRAKNIDSKVVPPWILVPGFLWTIIRLAFFQVLRSDGHLQGADIQPLLWFWNETQRIISCIVLVILFLFIVFVLVRVFQEKKKKGRARAYLTGLVQNGIMHTFQEIRNEKTDADDACCICCVEFGADETVLQMPCTHIFHESCLRDWLEREPICPKCRSPIGPATTIGGVSSSSSFDDDDDDQQILSQLVAAAEAACPPSSCTSASSAVTNQQKRQRRRRARRRHLHQETDEAAAQS